MAVSIEQVKPGAVFRFANEIRRVKSLSEHSASGFNVCWEYADGQARGGKLGGKQWVRGFIATALEELTLPSWSQETRLLLPAGDPAPCAPSRVEITVQTYCPGKWAFVDMETGELWGHDGQTFHRLAADAAGKVAHIAAGAAVSPH